MWHNDLDGDHKRTLNKYVGGLDRANQYGRLARVDRGTYGLLGQPKNGLPFRNGRNHPCIRRNKGLHRHCGHGSRKKSPKTGFIPNKPSIENISDWLGLRKDFTYWCQDSHVMFKDLYIRFGHSSFYAAYNQEFKISYREWNEVHPLAFAVALFGTMVFPHGSSLSINTRVITLVHTLFKGYENQGTTKYYHIAPVILSDLYRALGKFKEGHRYFQGCNLLLQ